MLSLRAEFLHSVKTSAAIRFQSEEITLCLVPWMLSKSNITVECSVHRYIQEKGTMILGSPDEIEVLRTKSLIV